MTELYRLQRQQSVGRSRQRKPRFRRGRLEIPAAALFSLNTALFAMEKNNVILRETNGFNVSNGSHDASRLRIRRARPLNSMLHARRSPAPSRGTNMRSRAPSRAARPSSTATTSTPRRATLHTPGLDAQLGESTQWRLRRWISSTSASTSSMPPTPPPIPGTRWPTCGSRWSAARRPARQPARRQRFRHALRRSRRLRFRQLPLFPGARPRGVPVRRLRPQLRGSPWPGSSTSSRG